MLYAFTDESYIGDNYLQGAFVVGQSDLARLDQIVSQTSEFAQGFGISAGTELRGYSIMNSKHGWEPLREKFHARVAVYKFLLLRIVEVKGTLHLVNEHPSLSNFELGTNSARHISTHLQLLKNLNNLGESSHQDLLIVSDEITSQDVLQENFIKESAQLTHIKSLTFVKSSNNSGVQIIDALLYLYQRMLQGNNAHHRTYKVTLELWEIASRLLQDQRS